MTDSTNGPEVELDQHGHAGRQLSALLSAALAAAQAGAQVAAQRARDRTLQADQQTRQAEQLSREQAHAEQARRQGDLAAQRQAERQQRTEQAVRHRQWGIKPTSQWLHDNPLSAAAAWASADIHRGSDPVAARHAEQWETIFKREGLDVEEVRANAPAAVAAAEQEGTPPSASLAGETAEAAGELAAAEVATGAVMTGAVDVAHAAAVEQDTVRPAASAGTSQWTAYADGAPAAALGGKGVSTPPNQVLAKARQMPDVATTVPPSAHGIELVNSNGLER